MRDDDLQQSGMFSYVSLEERVSREHPLRAIREIVDEILRAMDFDGMYAKTGRRLVPPERERLLNQEVARKFFSRVLTQAKPHLSDEHFNVDGTLIEAWASQKSFQKKDGGNGDAGQFHGGRRSNDTHQSKTDPDARLYRKGHGQEAKLGYLGHVLRENRHGLIVDALLTQAGGTAERDAALLMLCGKWQSREQRRPMSVGADKAADTRDFVDSSVKWNSVRT